jgi:UTP--glucose-1-phosphate uridylyltransferase
MSAEGLKAAEEKMRAAGQPEEAVLAFRRAYKRVEAGESAVLRSEELEPAAEVPAFDELSEVDPREALATTMGLRHPKSLVVAKDGRTFLDIIAGQTTALRRLHDIRLPLLLMNSEATRAETRQALSRHPELDAGLPLTFLQSMVPKIGAESLEPVSWPAEPELEWAPPGHGDVYGALRRSGALAALLDAGFRHAMISNIDNLGARVEPRIAAHLAADGIPFLMETVIGTEAERKGGHLARRRSDGQLVLRETAQIAPDDEQSFGDYRHWRYYNTNNLWVDLRALSDVLDRSGGVMELPLIVNRKTVDPRDPSSPAVLQLESAMGAAIQSFPGARLLCVPRPRFVPVKTTNDLLVLRSDAYRLTEQMTVDPAAGRDGKLPFVDLDQRFYRVIDEFESRFPTGPPSLRDAERLVVRGDVTFGRNVVVRGAVELDTGEPLRIDDGAVLGS